MLQSDMYQAEPAWSWNMQANLLSGIQYQPSASETFATSILQSEGESEGMSEEESEESTA